MYLPLPLPLIFLPLPLPFPLIFLPLPLPLPLPLTLLKNIIFIVFALAPISPMLCHFFCPCPCPLFHLWKSEIEGKGKGKKWQNRGEMGARAKTRAKSQTTRMPQFYNVRAFTASNKCRAVSFDARSSLLFSLIWIGDACSAPLSACIAGHTKGHFTGRPILPATSYYSELKGHLIWVISSNDWGKQRNRGRLQFRPV